MAADSRSKHIWLSLSPWAILGSLFVLAPIAIFIGVTSYNRDTDNMKRLLTEKGAALIRSFEAGTRTGMMHMGWGDTQFTRLLEETAYQPDIMFVGITDEQGKILLLALTNEKRDMLDKKTPNEVSSLFSGLPELPVANSENKVLTRLVDLPGGEGTVFEVYRQFRPIFPGPAWRGSAVGRHGMMMWPPNSSQSEPDGMMMRPSSPNQGEQGGMMMRPPNSSQSEPDGMMMRPSNPSQGEQGGMMMRPPIPRQREPGEYGRRSGTRVWPQQPRQGGSEERGGVHGQIFQNPPPRYPERYIFVGFDTAPLKAARSDAIRHAIFMAAIMVFMGLAGLISLFLAQGYKLAQRSLTRVRVFSDQVVEKMPLGLVATDEEGKVAAFNETAESILGRSTAEVLGKTAQDVLPDELKKLTMRLDKEMAVVEEVVECYSGRENPIPLSVSGALLRDQSGSFLGHVLIFRDLTEVRRLQKEVERSRRLASVGSLAAGVAHEIRNPLSSIKGFATYFRERYKDRPGDHETAEVMISEVERMDRVISQLLEFARPSGLNVRPSDVGELIRRSLRLIEGDAKDKGVEVRTEIDPALPPLPMDADRINQALLNLYINAIQAMTGGGVLTIKAVLNGNAESLKIKISDTGHGIDAYDKDHIFDPYYTTKSTGTGLGLAIVHKIVESHGGAIDVESEPGRGTTMTLILPMHSERNANG